jgi:mRNA interferase YafQ
MSLKNKPANNKRATLPRAVDFAKTFAKDWQRLDHSGRYDMRQLKEAMSLLINNDAPLGPEWLDHALKGQWEGHRECHIGGDFLLIYRRVRTLSFFDTVHPSQERRVRRWMR